MKTLRQCIEEAKNNKKAIGHFNVSNLEGVHAIANAAKSLNVPVIIGVSEGEREYIGVKTIASIVKSIREETGQEIFLNADHTYSVEKVKQAIDAGFDAAIFDGAQLTLEENILKAKECVEYAKGTGRDVIIEGELGYIGTSSKVLTEIPKGAAIEENMLTLAADAKRFVTESGVNMLAPAVGNIHGMFGKAKDPALNIKKIKEISEATQIPLVLHGASGNSDEDIKSAIQAGVVIVHVNTELRVAFRKGLEQALIQDLNEVSPYKYLKGGLISMQNVVEEKIKVFNS